MGMNVASPPVSPNLEILTGLFFFFFQSIRSGGLIGLTRSFLEKCKLIGSNGGRKVFNDGSFELPSEQNKKARSRKQAARFSGKNWGKAFPWKRERKRKRKRKWKMEMGESLH